MEQTIVIAIDHSAEAEQAVKFYLQRVHRDGNKVVLVHCIELPELSLNKARDAHMSPAVLADLWREEQEKIKILEEKMKTLLKEKQVPGVLRSSSGRPGEVICQIAEEVSAVMIITGTRGMGKVKRTILGSVSDYLVNHAICPVMVCRDPAVFERRRFSSGGDAAGKSKVHHPSGDSISSFAANLRQRFASGGRSHSKGSISSKSDICDQEKKTEDGKGASMNASDSDESVSSVFKKAESDAM